jgi:DNA-binding winged helix-turn-helix (wHTH) protein/tetratricopeptide (TPR) repeat protein
MPSSNSVYRFGEYELRVRARALFRQGVGVPLPSKTFEVLLYLVANSGRVVTKDELLKGVWPDSFVEESNLTQHVFRLRKALQPQPDSPPCIVTVPGQGYQFSVVVESDVESLTPAKMTPGTLATEDEIVVQTIRERSTVVTEEIVHQPPALLPAARRFGWKTVAGVAASAAALAVLGIWGWLATHHSRPSARANRRSIAVLGFRNLSGRPEEGWLSTALAEMLSTELVAGEKLRLVSGEEITRTKLDLHLADVDSLSRNTLARVHQDLDSDLIVLGSYTALVGQPDTRIRLDVRLQDTAAGETIADVAAVGSEANLFDLVSQAGAELREKLGVEAVSPVEAVSVRASLPSNRDAARLYSEGLARLRVFDALAARGLLEGAIAADPKYSLAHSALAEAWSRLGYDKKAQAEARQAYELAANLSREERFVVEGRYRDIDHEYDKAIEIYRSLFVLFPDNLDYGLKLAAVQVRAGKGHDALATVESLRKLMPPASELPLIDWQEVAAWEALGEIKPQEQPLARAVELARAQGSRLILARARQEQCWVYSHLEQLQDAVAACRESRDIYASAGDGYGEANSLTLWADAISEADATEAIRLYQQAEVIERKVGSEMGVATVLNNLGIVYGAQGDLAAAEKMYRQSLESFHLLGSKVNELKVTGNVADERREQGDLPGAIQLYQAALQLDRETDTGSANMIGFDVAVVHQLQGDLAGARQEMNQALQFWQKNGDRNSQAEAMSGLGNLLLEEADFSGARKMYEQALAIRKSGGDQLTIAQTQLELAELSLEEGHPPAEQEGATRQVIEVLQKQKARDDEIQAWCILARAMLAQGKAAAAADAIGHARALAGKSQDPEIRWRTAIAEARINSTGPAARKELDAVVAKSRELGYRGVELDARLALAEIEMKAGQTAAGRAHLAAIEADAKAKGYNLIARKASSLAHG